MTTEPKEKCPHGHKSRPVAAWLCVTSRVDHQLHDHVCGNHVRRYSRAEFVFRTIDPNARARWWLDGYGCGKPANITFEVADE